MAWATVALPVPDSPEMRTGVSRRASRAICSRSLTICGERPMSGSGVSFNARLASRSSIFGAMTIDTERTRAFVQKTWDADIIPALTDYIRIPAKSPMYDTKWAENGHIDRAVTLITDWAKARKIEGLRLEVVRLAGRTTVRHKEVPGAGADGG